MPKKPSVARQISYDVFVEVLSQNKEPNESLNRHYQKYEDIKKIDKSLAKEMLFGGLRWYKKIRWIIQNTSKKDLNTVSDEVRAALILGTYQIFYMDRIPDRSAVNESVEYIRVKNQHSALGFVNGILRSIARRAEYFAKPDKDKKPIDFLALQYSHPEWLVRRWLKRFGFEKVKLMLAANNHPPQQTIRVQSLKIEDVQDFRSQLLLKKEKIHSYGRPLKYCLSLSDIPSVETNSLFAEGYFTIQGEASQLIAHLVAPNQDEVILDACMGSGGKTSHMYELSKGRAHIIGLDNSKRHVEKAQLTFERLGYPGKIETINQDFLTYQPTQLINKILLDAPCSGLGVLRRHPEAKWQKNENIIEKIALIQKALLTHAIDILQVGGELVYAVSSFEDEETTEQLFWLKQQYKDKIRIISPVSRLPDYYKRYVTRDQLLMIYSGNKDEMDGLGAFIIKKMAP